MMYGDGHGGGWVVGMAIMMIVFWGSITALLWVGVRALLNRPPHRQEPRDILGERLARGEIEPEEFERRLELLHGPR
jgi:putative membrane protein